MPTSLKHLFLAIFFAYSFPTYSMKRSESQVFLDSFVATGKSFFSDAIRERKNFQSNCACLLHAHTVEITHKKGFKQTSYKKTYDDEDIIRGSLCSLLLEEHDSFCHYSISFQNENLNKIVILDSSFFDADNNVGLLSKTPLPILINSVEKKYEDVEKIISKLIDNNIPLSNLEFKDERQDRYHIFRFIYNDKLITKVIDTYENDVFVSEGNFISHLIYNGISTELIQNILHICKEKDIDLERQIYFEPLIDCNVSTELIETILDICREKNINLENKISLKDLVNCFKRSNYLITEILWDIIPNEKKMNFLQRFGSKLLERYCLCLHIQQTFQPLIDHLSEELKALSLKEGESHDLKNNVQYIFSHHQRLFYWINSNRNEFNIYEHIRFRDFINLLGTEQIFMYKYESFQAFHDLLVKELTEKEILTQQEINAIQNKNYAEKYLKVYNTSTAIDQVISKKEESLSEKIDLALTKTKKIKPEGLIFITLFFIKILIIANSSK